MTGTPTSRRGLLRAAALGGLGGGLGSLGGGLGGFGPAQGAGPAASATAGNGDTPGNRFFNAHHAPIGAYATFTLGYPGASGGFGIGQSMPGTQDVLIGVEHDGVATALPFFDAARETGVAAYAQDAVGRDFRLASDAFSAGTLRFTLYSPARPVPNPDGAAADPRRVGPLTRIAVRPSQPIEDVLLPAVFAELTLDNTGGRSRAVAFLAVGGGDAALLPMRPPGHAPGVVFGAGPQYAAIVAEAADAVAFTCRSVTALMSGAGGRSGGDALLSGSTGVGGVGGLAVAVPAGTRRTIRFALCFHRAGDATTNRPTAYWYARHYRDIAAVADAAMDGLPRRIAACLDDNALVDRSGLTPDQRFMLAHATRSYYGNTALLVEPSGAPWWMVIEGQYQNMNTFDLTVDQLFFELAMNPWTVRNELDRFARHYAYSSRIEVGSGTAPGGISFAHDMGQWPAFSPDGSSSYEKPDVGATYAFMTQEQLTNWTLIAGVYVEQTADAAWLGRNLDLFEQILSSLVARDDPDPARRDGIDSFNSSKVGSGAEITTYDSIGPGLTEAVGNTYIAGKTWASYVILERLLTLGRRPASASTARQQADRTAATMLRHITPQGSFASNVRDGDGISIIPVIEGLVYPFFAGRAELLRTDGRYGAFIAAMRRHLGAVLDSGACVTADGGWKLDSRSDNTWLSKTYLNEFIGRHILGLDLARSTARADAAAVRWLTGPASARLAWSDQFVDGAAIGSEYYPRGVTAILWLQEPSRVG